MDTNTNAPLKSFQKSFQAGQAEYRMQSIQVGIIFVLLRLVFGLTLGRTALLAALGWVGWKLSFVLMSLQGDRHPVPLAILAIAAVFYTFHVVLESYNTSPADASGAVLTRPLWSGVHFQRLMALAILIPAVLPIVFPRMVPRPDRYSVEAVAALVAERAGIVQELHKQLAMYDADRRDFIAEGSDPARWKTNLDSRVKEVRDQIAVMEHANAVVLKRGYVSEVDRYGNEALLMRK